MSVKGNVGCIITLPDGRYLSCRQGKPCVVSKNIPPKNSLELAQAVWSINSEGLIMTASKAGLCLGEKDGAGMGLATYYSACWQWNGSQLVLEDGRQLFVKDDQTFVAQPGENGNDDESLRTWKITAVSEILQGVPETPPFMLEPLWGVGGYSLHSDDDDWAMVSKTGSILNSDRSRRQWCLDGEGHISNSMGQSLFVNDAGRVCVWTNDEEQYESGRRWKMDGARICLQDGRVLVARKDDPDDDSYYHLYAVVPEEIESDMDEEEEFAEWRAVPVVPVKGAPDPLDPNAVSPMVAAVVGEVVLSKQEITMEDGSKIGKGTRGMVAEVKDTNQVKVDWSTGTTWSSSEVLRTLPEGFFLGQQVYIESGSALYKGAVGAVYAPGPEDGSLTVRIPKKQQLRIDGRKEPDAEFTTYAPNVKPMATKGCVIC